MGCNRDAGDDAAGVDRPQGADEETQRADPSLVKLREILFNLQQPPARGAAELKKRDQAGTWCAGSSSPSAPCEGELDECRAPLSLQIPLQAAGASPRRAVCVLVQRGWFRSLGDVDTTLEDKVRARSLEHCLVCSSLLARHTRGHCPSQVHQSQGFSPCCLHGFITAMFCLFPCRHHRGAIENVNPASKRSHDKSCTRTVAPVRAGRRSAAV